MRKNLNGISIILCLSLWMFAALGLNAQDVKIQGRVTDASTSDVVPGVNVIIKGTSKGVSTGADGTYQISAPTGSTLSYSSIGYKTQEIVVSTATDINVVLETEASKLDEIVVIGYGSVKKSDATGSIATVSSKDFNKGAISSAQELLVGKSAGVVITSSGGAPGAGATIRIRGGSSLSASNDPLIIIDGVPVDNTAISGMMNGLSMINPNDIETFTTLKDASATAIYGSRASNGVIIITTKRGKAGTAKKLSYNGNASVGIAPSFVDVLSGDEYRNLIAEKVGTNNITPDALLRLGSANTNWQKEIYRSAISHDHNLSLSGSAGKMPYRTSLGYTDQNGILKNTNMNRTTFSFGVDPQLLDNHLKIAVNGKGMYTNTQMGASGAVGSAVQYDPTKTVMNGNTRYAGYTTWTTDNLINGTSNQLATSNPVAQNDLTNNQSYVYRGIGNIQLDYSFHFLPELHANLNLGIDAYKSTGINNIDTIASWTRRSGFGQRTNYSQQGSNKLLDFYLNYVKSLDAISSKIDVTGGYSWQRFYRKGDNYQRSVVDAKHPLITADSSNYATESYLVSFFGRINYTLLNRYVVTVTLRDDGSSRFASNNQWGLFPSVALAWKLKDESFFKNVGLLSDLKLRLGWGQTGQQNITQSDVKTGDFPYLGTYQESVQQAEYQFGNKFYKTLRPNRYDPNIKWETTTTKNIGLDFGFLNDRISGSLDYYNRVTKDLINTIPIPNGSNFSNYLTTNVGSLENNGFEVNLNLRPVSTKDASWTIGFNASYNKNKITKLTRIDDPNYPGVPSGGIGGGTGNNIFMNSVGYATNSFFVLQQVYNAQGAPIEGLYVDRSGNGGNVAGNLNNFYHYKHAAPDYLMGISSKFNYKNFDIGFSGRISIGNYNYNNIASQTFYGNLFNNSYFQNLSRQIFDTKFSNAQYFSDIFIQNASFFRMDNMSVGYSFDKLGTDKLKGRVSFTVQNAFVITKYKGLDPEVDGGIDNNIYPRPRVFLLGVNLDL